MELNSTTEWKLELDEYLNGLWGNISGNVFKVPATYVEAYTIEVTDPNTGDLILEFDQDTAFLQLAQTYIDGIVEHYAILRRIKFGWLPEHTQKYLREAVYEAVQHALLNRQVWEKINTSTVNSGGLSVSNESTGWLITLNMFGKRGLNKLIKSEIEEYKIVNEGQMNVLLTTEKGNIEVIGQFDPNNIKELV